MEKQSTSLKEEIGTLIQEISDWRLNRTGGLVEADKILSLIQSHLVKEIKYKPTGFECDDYNQGYNKANKDIIKIINNIK